MKTSTNCSSTSRSQQPPQGFLSLLHVPTNTFSQSLPNSLSPSSNDFQELPPKGATVVSLDSVKHLIPTMFSSLGFSHPDLIMYFILSSGWGGSQTTNICPLLLLAFSSPCSCSAALFKLQTDCCAHTECLIQRGICSCSGLLTICNLPVTQAASCSGFILCLAPGGLNPHWMLFHPGITRIGRKLQRSDGTEELLGTFLARV